MSTSVPEIMGNETNVQHDCDLDRRKMRRRMALLERMKQRKANSKSVGRRSSDGERQGEFGRHVFIIRSFILPPVDKGKKFSSFFIFFTR